jgi:hypothetical protein
MAVFILYSKTGEEYNKICFKEHQQDRFYEYVNFYELLKCVLLHTFIDTKYITHIELYARLIGRLKQIWDMRQAEKQKQEGLIKTWYNRN